MSGLVDRARDAAEKRAAMLRGQVQQKLAEALPGVAQRVEGDMIILTGKRLVRRWIASGRLRDLGRWLP